MSSSEDGQADFELSMREMKDLKPDFRGLYTLCFHCNCRQPPLTDEDEIRDLFSPVAPIVSLTTCKGLQFVRFTTKTRALKAWKAFRATLQIKVADYRKTPNEQNPIETKRTETNRKFQDHSTNSGAVMLYLGNIAIEATEEEIQDFMSEINVLEWNIHRKQHKCYAFLKVSDHKEADKAMKIFNNTTFMNRTLFLRVFRTFRDSKSAASDSRTLTEMNDNNRNNEKFTMVDDNQNYDDLRPGMPPLEDIDSSPSRMPPLEDIVSSSKMPPLENIVSTSSDDDDESDSDKYLENPINGNTNLPNLDNFFHLFVGNFPYGTNEVNLMELFEPHQPINAFIINANDENRSTQGFVCFSNLSDLKEATVELDRTEYKKHILLVTASVCCMNIPEDKDLLQCTITAIPGESQYQRKVMLDKRHELCPLNGC